MTSPLNNSMEARLRRVEAALDRITGLQEQVKHNTDLIRQQLHLNVNFLQGIQAPMFDIKDEITKLAALYDELTQLLKGENGDGTTQPTD